MTVEKRTVSIEERNEANIHFDYGLTFLMQGKLDKAIASLNRAIELDPGFAEAYNNLGDIYMKKGMFETAVAAYEKSRSLKSNVENTHYDLGCAYALLKRYEDALESFKTALELDPAHYEIYGKIGALYLEIGGVERLIRMNLTGGQVDITRTNMKFIDEGLLYLEKAVRYDPTDIPSRFHAGRALLAKGKKELATEQFLKVIERYKSLIEIKRNYAEGYYFIGKSSYYLGKYRDAIENLSKAIELDTPEVDYHYSLGLAYHDADALVALAFAYRDSGDRASAEEFLKKALAREPKHEEALMLEEELKRV